MRALRTKGSVVRFSFSGLLQVKGASKPAQSSVCRLTASKDAGRLNDRIGRPFLLSSSLLGLSSLPRVACVDRLPRSQDAGRLYEMVGCPFLLSSSLLQVNGASKPPQVASVDRPLVRIRAVCTRGSVTSVSPLFLYLLGPSKPAQRVASVDRLLARMRAVCVKGSVVRFSFSGLFQVNGACKRTQVAPVDRLPW